MADSENPMAKAVEAMVAQQAEALRSYSDFWSTAVKGAQTAARNPFEAFQKGMADFAAKMPKADWMGEDGIMADTLSHLMDPSRMMQAGSADLTSTLQKLVEAPELSDIGMLERQGLKGLKEWNALKEAGTEYQTVMGKAWTRAFQTFSTDMSDKPDTWHDGPRAITDKWFAVLNDELIKTQRTSEFLEAHRKLLRGGVEYRLREREVIEAWCEARSMPTRTEVDDLHKSVYALRKEMRSLKKELAAAKGQAKAPKKKVKKNG